MRSVTGTLPHEDWLIDAHLSDGSILEVTEDHRFWSVTDTAWVELQDLDADDILLTPDGVTVTVDWLDWSAGADAPAFDLTVAEEHNFFVTAETNGEQLLVHNMTPGIFCDLPVSVNTALDLLPVDELLRASSDTAQVSRMLLSLSRKQRVKMLDVIAVSGPDVELGATIARNASFGDTNEVFERSVGAARVALQQTPEVAAEALGNSQYRRFLTDPSTSDWLVESIGYRSHLLPGPNGSWVSPEGLQYRLDPLSDVCDTRVDHVLNHARAQPGREGSHGVFDTASPLATVDDAWSRRGSAVAVFETVEDGVVKSRSYVVEFDSPVGFVSGEVGEAAGRPTAFFVEVVVDPNDPSIVLTAYPRLAP